MAKHFEYQIALWVGASISKFFAPVGAVCLGKLNAELFMVMLSWRVFS